jgi:hypothetical protein
MLKFNYLSAELFALKVELIIGNEGVAVGPLLVVVLGPINQGLVKLFARTSIFHVI